MQVNFLPTSFKQNLKFNLRNQVELPCGKSTTR